MDDARDGGRGLGSAPVGRTRNFFFRVCLCHSPKKKHHSHLFTRLNIYHHIDRFYTWGRIMRLDELSSVVRLIHLVEHGQTFVVRLLIRL